MPGGRPTNIDQIVGYTDRDGERIPITAFDRIVSAVGIGVYHEIAAASAGIADSTLRDWLRTGARAIARAATRGRPYDDPALGLTPLEIRCVEFSAAVAEAEARWEVGALTTLQRLGNGGTVTTSTTVKTQRQERPDPNDARKTIVEYVEVERVTRTDVLAPNPQVLEWRLTRRFPSRYALNRDDDALAFEDEDAAAATLADELRSYLQGVEDGMPTKKRRRAAAAEPRTATGEDS